MPLDIPLPTASPEEDPAQYTPLLLSAIEGFLLARDVWAEADYAEAYNYMQALMDFIVDLMGVYILSKPIGATMMWWTDTAPDGWLFMGETVSKTTYPELFDIFGYTYGGGSDMFVLPTMDGYSPYGAGADVDLGDTGGADTHTLSTGELPSHSHSVTDPGHNHLQQIGAAPAYLGTGGTGRVAYGALTTASTTRVVSDSGSTGISIGNTGSASPFSLLHAVRACNFIIFAGR